MQRSFKKITKYINDVRWKGYYGFNVVRCEAFILSTLLQLVFGSCKKMNTIKPHSYTADDPSFIFLDDEKDSEALMVKKMNDNLSLKDPDIAVEVFKLLRK